MKYFVIIFIIISICASSINVLAQQQESSNSALPDNAIELLEIIQTDNSNNYTYSVTDQIGNNNDLEIFSAQQEMLESNIVAIGQYGNNNSGIINQNGFGQELGIYQNGNQNTALITANGSNIFDAVTQVGNNNYVEHDIENDYSSSAELKIVSSEQYGNSNSITLQTAMDFSTVEVVQNGNNNNVELDLTNAGLQTDPYRVEQTGNNAEVVITKSDFYMPMQSKVQ